MQIAKITLKEANRLKKIYIQQEIIIKAKLKASIDRGNEPKYLAHLLLEIQQEIRTLKTHYDKFTDETLKTVFKDQTQEIDKQIYRSGMEANFSKPSEKAINILAQNTKKDLTKVTMLIGRQSEDFLRRVGLKHSQGVVFGSDTWKQASKSMLTELKEKKMFHVEYKLKDGTIRKVPSQVYTEMVARTTAAEANRMATIQRITENGGDLVVVQGRSSYPDSPCVPYQGKVLSISGKSEDYGSLENAKANGLFHPNCVHNAAWSDKNKELGNIETPKVITKPKVEQFKPAKSREEAEKWAVNKIAKKADFKGLDLETISNSQLDNFRFYEYSIGEYI